ncbi:MAG: chlorophyll synthesis pathway protein BchC [Pseudomonadota bacterium]
METLAVVLKEPRAIGVQTVALAEAGPGDVVVDTTFSSISSGTERLLWQGSMPPFPGMGYPLVPGYETVGRVVEPGTSQFTKGSPVFVPGARCYKDVHALFGGAAARTIHPAERLIAIPSDGEEMTLLALAATAYHAIAIGGAPDLIVGHGVLGRLVARLTLALGHLAPVVHETAEKRTDAVGYRVCNPQIDERRDYRVILDASGHPGIIDDAVSRLAHGGQLTLAGFYKERLDFAFPPAFMREASIQIAAEWKAQDMAAVTGLVESGKLDLTGLITHRAPIADASTAYDTAFSDPDCLKMVLAWGESR